MKIRAQIAHGAEPRQVHRLPHLLGDLQERVDQPRRRRIRLVQQRRDQARHRLSQGLGKPEALERRLAAQEATARSSRASASKWRILANIFANPDLPEIDDYYEPFTFDYEHLQTAPEMKAFPTARPRSLITGERMEKIEWGPNWEEILGGEFDKRSKDVNFEGIQKEIYGQFENTFMMYLPRLCEHCLNPTCVAACPSGAIYKREEDGIVLIDQDKCRGWRMCVSGCPYKKIYYNWKSGKVREVHLLLPAHRGRPADGLLGDLRRAHPLSRRRALRRRPHRGGRLDRGRAGPLRGAARHLPRPHDPAVIAQARADGIADNWLEAAQAARRSARWRWSGRSPSRCTPNTAPCRWSGTCRRCRRSRIVGEPARSGSTARCPTSRASASRSNISPTC